MKRITALLITILMVFVITACGGSTEESEPEQTSEPVAEAHEVSGLVEGLSDAKLSIYTETAQELTFNIENADVESEDGINAGDTATVEYEGEVTDGNTDACKVTKVTAFTGAESGIVGTVDSIGSDGTITITKDNNKYTFKTSDAGSFKAGDKVEIRYTGMIDGEDTSHAFVRSIKAYKGTEDTEAAAKLKVVDETVWVSADVNVRAEASTDSDRITTLKKGTKLKRTGVLDNGWSRVTYENKDRYVSSAYLTLKASGQEKKDSEAKNKDNETKAKQKEASKEKQTEEETEAAAETKTAAASESKTEQKTETAAEPAKESEAEAAAEPAKEPEAETAVEPEAESAAEPEAEPEAETEAEPEAEAEKEEPEPSTVTAQGTVTEMDDKTITLDNGKTYKLKDTKLDIKEDEAAGKKVVVEYYEESMEAVHVYPVDGSKALDNGSSSGTGAFLPFIIVTALLAIAVASAVVVIRNKRSR